MQDDYAKEMPPDQYVGLIRLLQLGTLVGFLLILSGLLMPSIWTTDPYPSVARRLIQGGVALFILLPSARVALLFCLYFQAGDMRMAAVSAAVLIILGASLCFAF
ncbi:DUF1634 domain-containing protein [Rhizobium sp. BK376]|jgi:hypothetical protein|uniref:DUF1634 domain-containing protein n=1 Tax=Rhizobium sp. BK376 TaxID=2512149 RepID=UPI00104F7488|nr:DUF1634 domain-containing protein [Rhizobium sp. BK376]TCR79585.1 uncharacterized protein DUF1634 [Rhizobium sp. BK376]